MTKGGVKNMEGKKTGEGTTSDKFRATLEAESETGVRKLER